VPRGEEEVTQEDDIPIARRAPRPLTGQDIFGVVVRSSGLAIAVWGFYTAIYMLGQALLGFPLSGYKTIYGGLVMAGVWLAVGVSLLRGEWLVRFAYGERHDS
jgi:hypothetical protein